MTCSLIATRSLSSSLRCFAKSVRKTTFNPVAYTPRIPLLLPQPKSVIIFSTPSQLSSVIDKSFALNENKGVQVIVAAVDTVGPGSVRDGVLEMWLDEQVRVIGTTLLNERDDVQREPQESDGVNVVAARKNWKKIDGLLSVLLSDTCTAQIPLANTAFHTNRLVTLFHLDANGTTASSGKELCEMMIKLPSDTIFARRIETRDKWVSLQTNDTPLIVTGCVGNLLKTVNGGSAASILESSDTLMSIGSKDTLVFVKVWHHNRPEAYKYEVIAGGGGWGAKANIIALSPEAKLNKGDRIEFYMVTPTDRFENDMPQLDDKECIVLESSFEEQEYYDDKEERNEVERKGIFGGGSEEGFTLNGVRFCSPGEQVVIDV